MKEKEIYKEINLGLYNLISELGFKFNAKLGSFIREDKDSGLFFEFALVFFKKATIHNSNAKSLEIFVNIYHNEISKKLLDTSERSFLGSIFSFKILGNLLGDIILNENNSQYLKKNNYNYFDLMIEDAQSITICIDKLKTIFTLFIVPFFNKFKTLEKIEEVLENAIETECVFNNEFSSRLLSLIAIKMYLKKEYEAEYKRIEIYLVKVNNNETLLELKRLVNNPFKK